jgi:type I restriction enzyme S subunit
MKLNYKKLGDYIQLVDERNKNLEISNLLGVSIQKKFIPSIANVSETDMSVYRIVRKNQFAFSPVTSRNGDKFTIALLKEAESAIISPAYQVFEVIDGNLLLPEYLFIFVNRAEFDRYTRFNSWGSARETFTWEDVCDIEMPIPDIKVQKNVVAVYNELLRNQKCYEGSLDDLQLICDTFIEDLTKKKDLKRLGDYIEKITAKNTDDKLKSLVGISERKEFRTPSGKVNKENLSNHLIVNWGEFAYIPRMNPFKPLAVAVSFFEYPILVSPSYVAFKIIDTDILLPEFLLLFFKRSEFDRYAAYNAWSSTRDTFNWEDMCEVRLPIPDIEVQKSIVAIHHVLESRKKLNEDLKNMITPLCPVLMKGVVDTLITK